VVEENNPILVRKQKWLKLRLALKERFGKVPDVNAVLLLIGVREVGKVQAKYEKEEKEELMHVGTCTVLSLKNYYTLTHWDDDGFPHFIEAEPLPKMDVKEQEHLLITSIIEYFERNELM
jgi:hypothetical protein